MTDPELSQASDPKDGARGAAEQESADPASGQPASPSAAQSPSETPSQSASQSRSEPQSPTQPRTGPGAESEPRVGVVLVSHSHEVAIATADLALALVGSGVPAPVATAGGVEGGGIGTSATLIRKAIKHVDAGRGVVVLCDMGSAVLTVKALLAETGEGALPDTVRIADAPFLEGAVAALVTASAGAGLDLVISATDDARMYRKL
ncbi:PTS fructose transporter subunit IIA [Streptomyces sp. NPDC004647]|uniref:PTS-dependent dihydroxyacetone kinase phosphotransferase subunit DhaM n=1 Tax=Streptomyces sp. NPDC004647 TaxID=3154671 RepID=UPI0033A362E6